MSKPGPITAKPLSTLLGGVVSDVFAKQGFASRELVTRWAEIAGPEIARHSEPLKMQWPRPVEGQPQEPATLVAMFAAVDRAYARRLREMTALIHSHVDRKASAKRDAVRSTCEWLRAVLSRRRRA